MARFLGTVQGNRGEASRCGSSKSGLRSTVASWQGAVQTFLYVDEEGYDCFRVEIREWYGHGPRQRVVLKEGRFVDQGNA